MDKDNNNDISFFTNVVIYEGKQTNTQNESKSLLKSMSHEKHNTKFASYGQLATVGKRRNEPEIIVIG